MGIEVLDISKCKDGYILAEDIASKHGAAVATTYTALNSYIINKLNDLGINRIKVFKPGSDQIDSDVSIRLKRSYGEKAFAAKEILSEVAATGKLDVKKINKLSDSIYSEVGETDFIIGCLNEIRNLDEYTYYHCLNVSFYSALIGRWLQLPEDEIAKVIKSGLLHDIGKTKVSSEIINKKSKLFPREFEEIKMHTIYGFDMIEKAKYVSADVKIAVLMHHEREDGSGYPYGHGGEQITKYAKIIAVADVYDAMTSQRVYRKKATPFEVFEMFMTEGVNRFDISIMNTFLKNIAPYYVGSKVELNTGMIGEVVYIPPHCITRPVIKVGTRYIDLSKDEGYGIIACSF
ncbi:MAG: HD-GYP domain-containing protein [Bacillota bacterium]